LSEEQAREVYVRKGREQMVEFTYFFNIVFDRYHEIIGDQATLYYMYLLRKRNNQENNGNYGRAWDGRKGVLEKFRMGAERIAQIDKILKAAGLIEIEEKPSGRGKKKIYYIVNDALPKDEFNEKEPEIVGKIMALIAEDSRIAKVIGKEFEAKYLS
jgi:hypothetical protein